MSMRNRMRGAWAAALLAVGVAGLSGAAWASDMPKFGKPIAPAELAAWAISIPPSGAGLPAGSGTAKQGAPIFAEKCQVCHGEKGAGKPADVLAGGMGTLSTRQPVRTVGSYWPYATTLFDYIRRAMPYTAPQSLTADEGYALSAYILFLNGIVAEDAAINATTLPQVKMPNRDGFVSEWPLK
jgi:mono/diheme cytochrome c family protein